MNIKKLNEQIEQMLLENNNEINQALDLLFEISSKISVDPSFFGTFGKTFDNKLNKILKIKTPSIKLKKARDLLFDASNNLIDEQFDELADKIDKFLFQK